MKRFIIFLVVFVVSFICIQQVKSLPNPWIDCGDDISCAAKKAGFNFPLCVSNYHVRAMDGMMEISFPIDKKRTVIVRKVQEYDGPTVSDGLVDISGVYNKYKVNKKTCLKNGISFWTRGEDRKFYVALFAAESGYYSFYCPKGLKIKDLEYLYKLLEEAEAPGPSYDKNETLTIEQLQDLRRVDGIVEPVYSQDYLPKELIKRGVTQECFERANLGSDVYCSASELKMIKQYYRN